MYFWGRRQESPTARLFCDIPRLTSAFLQQADSVAVKKRFSRLHREARELELSRVQNLRFRNWLQATGVQQHGANPEVDAPRMAHHLHTMTGRTDPYTDQELQELFTNVVKPCGQQRWQKGLLHNAKTENQTMLLCTFIGEKMTERTYFSAARRS